MSKITYEIDTSDNATERLISINGQPTEQDVALPKADNISLETILFVAGFQLAESYALAVGIPHEDLTSEDIGHFLGRVFHRMATSICLGYTDEEKEQIYAAISAGTTEGEKTEPLIE